jgi:hypothetical protein
MNWIPPNSAKSVEKSATMRESKPEGGGGGGGSGERAEAGAAEEIGGVVWRADGEAGGGVAGRTVSDKTSERSPSTAALTRTASASIRA